MTTASYSIQSETPTPPDIRGILAVAGLPTELPWSTSAHVKAAGGDQPATTVYTHTLSLERPMTDTDTAPLGAETAPEDDGAPQTTTEALNDREPLSFTAAQAEAEQDAQPDPLEDYVVLAEVPARLLRNDAHIGTAILPPIMKRALEGVTPENIGTIKLVDGDDTIRLVMSDGYDPAVEGADDDADGFAGFLRGLAEAAAREEGETPDLGLNDIFGRLFAGAPGGPMEPQEIDPQHVIAKVRDLPDDAELQMVVNGLPLEGYEALATAWADVLPEAAKEITQLVARCKLIEQTPYQTVFRKVTKEAFIAGQEALIAFTETYVDPEEVKANCFHAFLGLGLAAVLTALDAFAGAANMEEITGELNVRLDPETLADVMVWMVKSGLVLETEGAFEMSIRGTVLHHVIDLGEATLQQIADASDASPKQVQKALDFLVAGGFVKDDGGTYAFDY